MNTSTSTPENHNLSRGKSPIGRPTRLRRLSARRPGWLIAMAIVAISTVFLATSIGLDYWRMQEGRPTGFSDFGLFDWWVKERFVEVLIFWWVIAFGASVGSFLNVVIYRMPLGMSLSAKSSHCVWCKAKIYSRDNLPIIGWLLLRGRCRKCRLPISGRYPLVETITALLGLILFIVMVQIKNYGLGPYVQSPIYWHFWLMNFAPIGQLVFYFFFFWLLAYCIAIAWIDFDKNRIPIKLVLSSSMAALVIPLITLLIAKPYFEQRMMTNLEFRFLSPSVLEFLQQQGLGTEELWGIETGNARFATNIFLGQIAGGVVGAIAAFVIWFLLFSAFPKRNSATIENQTFDNAKSIAIVKKDNHGLSCTLMVLIVAGLFGGPVFVALLAGVHFVLSILATPLLMNSRFSPLDHRWFMLPYSLLIAILLWRFAESILING